MTIVASIVEGDGEVGAVPVLLRALNAKLSPQVAVEVRKPIRVHRERFLNRLDDFQRYLQLAASQCNDRGWILILLDADDDCPADRSVEVFDRARAIVHDRPISVVFANREYEAWFIASASSLHGKRGFVYNETHIPQADTIRNAKGWLGERMAENKYREVTDQPAFSAIMDIDQARANSRSFRKLCSEWEKNMLT